VYWHEGRAYVVGKPGNEYRITLRNRMREDLLAVFPRLAERLGRDRRPGAVPAGGAPPGHPLAGQNERAFPIVMQYVNGRARIAAVAPSLSALLISVCLGDTGALHAMLVVHLIWGEITNPATNMLDAIQSGEDLEQAKVELRRRSDTSKMIRSPFDTLNLQTCRTVGNQPEPIGDGLRPAFYLQF